MYAAVHPYLAAALLFYRGRLDVGLGYLGLRVLPTHLGGSCAPRRFDITGTRCSIPQGEAHPGGRVRAGTGGRCRAFGISKNKRFGKRGLMA